MKPLKLNLGCGQDKRIGYVNIDSSLEVNPDRVWDLEKKKEELKKELEEKAKEGLKKIFPR